MLAYPGYVDNLRRAWPRDFEQRVGVHEQERHIAEQLLDTGKVGPENVGEHFLLNAQDIPR